MRNLKLILAPLLLGLAMTAAACAPSEETAMEEAPMDAPAPGEEAPLHSHAVAVLHPTQGNSVTGVVHFIQSQHGVRVLADVQGLTAGDHGFHIHQYGDSPAPDRTSAGGHFNPQDMPHGGPQDQERHVGDLGNLTADASGAAHLERTDPLLSFSGAHSIIGRGLIVHAEADDLTSQPTGAAGPRVACAVIGIAEPE